MRFHLGRNPRISGFSNSPFARIRLDLFRTTIDRAVSPTNRGEVAAGHNEFLDGLGRTETVREDYEAWNEGLARHCERALESFVRVSDRDGVR
jgi:hypothetical protein